MAEIVHRGSWFLPNSEKKFPGHIIVDDKSIKLEIFGQESIEGTNVLDSLKSKSKFHHPIILGVDREFITLYNCQWAGTKSIGENLCQITYEIQYTFIGCHIEEEKQLKVKAGTFSFPHVASWYDGSSILDKMPISNLYPNDLSNDQKKELSEQVIVNENLTLTLSDCFETHYPSLGFHHSLKYDKLIHFSYEEDVPFGKLLEDAVTFLRLLEFVCGKPLRLKIHYVDINKTYADFGTAVYYLNRDIHRIYIGNHTLSNGAKIEQGSRHQRYMLFSRWNMPKEELNQIIVKWFSIRENLIIYDYYLDANNWFEDSDAIISNVMFNNRFLNIIQGLEAFYNKRKDKDQIIDSDFKENKKQVLNLIDDLMLREWVNKNLQPPQTSLKEKLNWILKEFNNYFEKIFGIDNQVLNFPDYAKKIRNTLSHGRNNKTDLGPDLHINFFIGRIILAVCILESLGIKDIDKKICHYHEFERDIYEIELQSRQERLSNTSID